MSTATQSKVVVTRCFNAARERVFDAWLDQDLIGRWMFGRKLRDEDVMSITLEPRVGGRFSFVVRRDGERIDHVGEYLAIERPHHLAFSWGIAGLDSSRVVVEIAPRPPGCELTLTHELDPDWADHAERTRGGWSTLLHALDSELAPPALTAAAEGYGVMSEPDTLRLERILPGPIDRVWTYLTDSSKRGLWLASGPMELRPGGAVELEWHNDALSPELAPTPERFRKYEGYRMQGRIIRCYPPHVLAFTWDDSEVTFELAPRGDSVVVALTHRRLKDLAQRLDVASGWHSHLGILIDLLNGRTPRNFWLAHAELEEEYAKRLGR